MGSIDFLSLLIFVLALGAMIFLHEFGHFLAARFFKIDVDEFGFGLPPRALGLWRSNGYLVFNRQRVEIPQNFERDFDWQNVLNWPAVATVDQMENKYILRTLKITMDKDILQPAVLNQKEILVDANGKPVQPSQTVGHTSKTIGLGKERGAVEWNGEISEVHAGTPLSLNWLPLGGFVRPKGENDPNIPGGLAAANPWKRIAVLLAGPIMNLTTAVVVFGLITAMQGVPTTGPVSLEEISPDSPAQQAGLQPKDVIVSINGQAVDQNSDVSTVIYDNLDKPLNLVVDRNGHQLTLTVTPLSSRYKAGQGPIGILMSDPPTRPATIVEVVSDGVVMTGLQAAGLVYLPIALVQGVIAPDQARLVGLKGIFDIVNVAVQKDVSSRQAEPLAPGTPTSRPTNSTLFIIAALSVSLGVINLFPVPALDGGRILFTLPEILFHRRIPMEFENMVNGVAMLLLIGFMIFINVMDFINPAVPPTLP